MIIAVLKSGNSIVLALVSVDYLFRLRMVTFPRLCVCWIIPVCMLNSWNIPLWLSGSIKILQRTLILVVVFSIQSSCLDSDCKVCLAFFSPCGFQCHDSFQSLSCAAVDHPTSICALWGLDLDLCLMSLFGFRGFCCAALGYSVSMHLRNEPWTDACSCTEVGERFSRSPLWDSSQLPACPRARMMGLLKEG